MKLFLVRPAVSVFADSITGHTQDSREATCTLHCFISVCTSCIKIY